jgi:hypothetical protein
VVAAIVAATTHCICPGQMPAPRSRLPSHEAAGNTPAGLAIRPTTPQSVVVAPITTNAARDARADVAGA